MSDEPEDFETFIRKQFPFRPEGHPDWVKLQKVVAQVEEMKAQGLKAEQTYEKIADVYSLSYLAANRAGMNIPDKPKVTRVEAVEYMTNGWVEGFLYGVLFDRLGDSS
jgi:hypothetical protein